MFAFDSAKQKNKIKNELTWDPSGLLLPAGPGGRPLTAVTVLLAMLVATGKSRETLELHERQKKLWQARLWPSAVIQVEHRCDEEPLYQDHSCKSEIKSQTLQLL